MTKKEKTPGILKALFNIITNKDVKVNMPGPCSYEIDDAIRKGENLRQVFSRYSK